MHDWIKCEKEGFRTRDAHLIKCFEKNRNVNKILVIDRPLTIPEILLKKKFWRVRNGKVIKKSPSSFLTKVSEKIYVLDIFSYDIIKPLIYKRDWWDYIFKKSSIIVKIGKTIKFLNLNNKILFLWTPMSTGVIGKLDEQMVVFDTLDNWTRHPEIRDKRGWISKGYKTIKERADIIFANSVETQQFMNNLRTDPILVLNGVDKDFFQVENPVLPDDIKNINKPIVGYIGKLARRFDVALISFLAKELPYMNFVILGQILNKDWIKPLYRYKNIYILGDRHYSLMSHYLKNFDICIIPHNIRSQDSGENSIKLYEYLAAGKPVVTTNFGGVEIFKDNIKIAFTKEDFLEGIIDYNVKLTKDRDYFNKLKNLITSELTWGHKANFMINEIIKIYKNTGNL